MQLIVFNKSWLPSGRFRHFVVLSFLHFCCIVVAVAYTFDRSSVSFSFAILFVISFSLSSRSRSGRWVVASTLSIDSCFKWSINCCFSFCRQFVFTSINHHFCFCRWVIAVIAVIAVIVVITFLLSTNVLVLILKVHLSSSTHTIDWHAVALVYQRDWPLHCWLTSPLTSYIIPQCLYAHK